MGSRTYPLTLVPHLLVLYWLLSLNSPIPSHSNTCVFFYWAPSTSPLSYCTSTGPLPLHLPFDLHFILFKPSHFHPHMFFDYYPLRQTYIWNVDVKVLWDKAIHNLWCVSKSFAKYSLWVFGRWGHAGGWGYFGANIHWFRERYLWQWHKHFYPHFSKCI